ncbi:MAG: amino acid transporter [Dehalococcoidia bacterium]
MVRHETPWGVWDPLTPAEVGELLRGIEAPWWIAGGYAIEAFAGRELREHGDVDVGLLRRDQLAVQRTLDGWELHAADPPGTLRPWLPGEHLPRAIHDIWVREDGDGPWRFQLMLDESEGEEWVFRRDTRVRRELGALTWKRDPLSYIAPEVQLLYKSKGLRAKDQVDFAAAEPVLSDRQRAWLRDALELVEPGHPWLAALSTAPPGS